MESCGCQACCRVCSACQSAEGTGSPAGPAHAPLPRLVLPALLSHLAPRAEAPSTGIQSPAHPGPLPGFSSWSSLVSKWCGVGVFFVLPSLQRVGLSSAAGSGNFPSEAVVAVKAQLCPAVSDKDGGPSTVGQSDSRTAPSVKETPFLLYFKIKGGGGVRIPLLHSSKTTISSFSPETCSPLLSLHRTTE